MSGSGPVPHWRWHHYASNGLYRCIYCGKVPARNPGTEVVTNADWYEECPKRPDRRQGPGDRRDGAGS